MTPALIAELRKLLAKAPRLPRRMALANDEVLAEYPPTRGLVQWVPTEAELRLFVAVWPKLPALLDRIERLERALAKALDWFAHHSFSHDEECPAVCRPFGACRCEAQANNEGQDALVAQLRAAVSSSSSHCYTEMQATLQWIAENGCDVSCNGTECDPVRHESARRARAALATDEEPK